MPAEKEKSARDRWKRREKDGKERGIHESILGTEDSHSRDKLDEEKVQKKKYRANIVGKGGRV